MTIFDIAPMSYWRRLYRVAYYDWLHKGKDTPRGVCEIVLLREVNRRLRRELAAYREEITHE